MCDPHLAHTVRRRCASGNTVGRRLSVRRRLRPGSLRHRLGRPGLHWNLLRRRYAASTDPAGGTRRRRGGNARATNSTGDKTHSLSTDPRVAALSPKSETLDTLSANDIGKWLRAGRLQPAIGSWIIFVFSRVKSR